MNSEPLAIFVACLIAVAVPLAVFIYMRRISIRHPVVPPEPEETPAHRYLRTGSYSENPEPTEVDHPTADHPLVDGTNS